MSEDKKSKSGGKVDQIRLLRERQAAEREQRLADQRKAERAAKKAKRT